MVGTLQEAEIIPYKPGQLPGSRWLVLAPHPDDEVLGAGATLAAAAALGCELTTVCVTSGGAQGEAPAREREAEAASRELGLAAPEFWRLPDRGLGAADRELGRRVDDVLARVAPDIVLVPSPVELHPDHRSVAWALRGALRRRSLWGWRRGLPLWVAAYEVSVPILPNLLVKGDATWEQKRRALACYDSQLAIRPYEAVMEGLEGASGGQAFDKAAQLLGLEYPGGPAIDRAARQATRRDGPAFPQGRVRAGHHRVQGDLRPELCVSFSGLKTALMYH
ncbi:MAG TPA: PIG-L family deacetylase, partial [Thermoanaerobaculaceae bacterium]|nr:PIG-L family deacetylase [Thermoanaerobaculaceae bacterium]